MMLAGLTVPDGAVEELASLLVTPARRSWPTGSTAPSTPR